MQPVVIMKNPELCSVLTTLAVALVCSSAKANLAIPHLEVHSQLVSEAVEVEITGDKAEVTGTFTYTKPKEAYFDLKLYLPVYAQEGTPVKQIQPEIFMGEKKLEVYPVIDMKIDIAHPTVTPRPTTKDNDSGLDISQFYGGLTVDSNIADFGELPQLEGQRVYWFMVPHVPQYPVLTGNDVTKDFSLKIRYTQKLSNNKFIYTPLIPKQKKEVDYGSISVSADRKLSLLDSNKHSFVEKEGKLIIDPSDKRAIVVELAKAKTP